MAEIAQQHIERAAEMTQSMLNREFDDVIESMGADTDFAHTPTANTAASSEPQAIEPPEKPATTTEVSSPVAPSANINWRWMVGAAILIVGFGGFWVLFGWRRKNS
jgi:hypothetical protein